MLAPVGDDHHVNCSKTRSKSSPMPHRLPQHVKCAVSGRGQLELQWATANKCRQSSANFHSGSLPVLPCNCLFKGTTKPASTIHLMCVLLCCKLVHKQLRHHHFWCNLLVKNLLALDPLMLITHVLCKPHFKITDTDKKLCCILHSAAICRLQELCGPCKSEHYAHVSVPRPLFPQVFAINTNVLLFDQSGWINV